MSLQKEEAERLQEKNDIQKYINKKLIQRNQELFEAKSMQESKAKKRGKKIRSLKANISYKQEQIENLIDEKLQEKEKKEFYLSKLV